MIITQLVQTLLTDRRYWLHLAALVIVGDAILTELTIHFIRYTEIDWETYMVQIQLYLKGQRDYAMITGPTGPLVYPAGHVHIHRFLYEVTDSGQNIRLAQHVYALLYICSVCLVVSIYRKAGSVPNWVLLLLPLSKRLHSIYVLRLFNDCWSVVAVQAAILAFQHGMDGLGTTLYSLALSVKMSAFLYLPGLLVIWFLRGGLVGTFRRVLHVISIQLLFASPFLKKNVRSYLHFAFDFSRVFLYKWTVNWRMVSEETFLNPSWAKGLLLGHVAVLSCFGLFRWLSPQGGLLKVLDRGLRRPTLPAAITSVNSDYVATILFTSNLIGILFARSLHYQFYSWYSQQVPFLALKTPYHLAVKIVLIAAIEYSWNIFPSTPISSSVLLSAHSLLVLGLWWHPYSRTKSD